MTDKEKNILLLCLLGLVIVFVGMWYFKPSNTKDDNKALQNEIDQIQKQRDSLANDIKIREGQALILQDSIRNGERRIASIDSMLQNADARLAIANKNVKDASDYYNILLKKLANLQANPGNRQGDALIRSLKEKLNK